MKNKSEMITPAPALSGGLNPLAVEAVKRWLRDQEPMFPESSRGLILPMSDLVAALDAAITLFARAMEPNEAAGLRQANVTARKRLLAAFGGGKLIQL